MTNINQPIVISVGGSLIIPDQIDTVFLRQFKELIEGEVEKGKRFVLIVGGGKTCRRYQAAAQEVTEMSGTDLDWLGIHSTRFNAQFVRSLFKGIAHDDIVFDPTLDIDWKQPVLIGAGWEPGCSSDFDAILFAEKYNAQKVINLSNIDYVYDKDPNKFDDAIALKDVTWDEYRKTIPDEWTSGMNTPFDPIASKKAQENNMEVTIINGSNIDEVRKYLHEEEFVGTRIHT